MRRKKLIVLGIALFLIVVGTAGTLLWALLRVPDFYTTAAANLPREPEQRKLAAKQLVQETTNLVNNIKHADDWSAAFKQVEINSWFAEELRQEKYQDVVPEGVSDPRLVIEEGRLQLGFRYERKGWSGIVSLQLKPWIQSENQLAIEIESIKAGIVPIPLEEMLHDLSRQLANEGWNVSWNQANGHDVAIITLDQHKGDAPALESIVIEEGEVRIRGRRKTQPPAEPHIQQTPQTARSNSQTPFNR